MMTVLYFRARASFVLHGVSRRGLFLLGWVFFGVSILSNKLYEGAKTALVRDGRAIFAPRLEERKMLTMGPSHRDLRLVPRSQISHEVRGIWGTISLRDVPR